MPEKERSLNDLKEQVTNLQEEIHRLEGKHQQKTVKTLFRWQSFSRPYAEHSYLWDELDDFWITEKRGFTLLQIDTFLQWPRRLIILINKDDKEKVQEVIARYLPFRELPKTGWFDSLADTLAK